MEEPRQRVRDRLAAKKEDAKMDRPGWWSRHRHLPAGVFFHHANFKLWGISDHDTRIHHRLVSGEMREANRRAFRAARDDKMAF